MNESTYPSSPLMEQSSPSTPYGERTFMVVVTFADIDRDVHGMADTIWTSESAYINIEEGTRLRYRKPFRTAYRQ